MNWGYKIVLGLGAFILLIVSFGIYMVSQDTDTLEETDYYERSLSYDSVYEQKENVLLDAAKPTVGVEQDSLIIQFTQPASRGTLVFKRPSDGELDISLPFESQSGRYVLPVTSFKKGLWNLQISWKSGDKSYRYDHSLYF